MQRPILIRWLFFMVASLMAAVLVAQPELRWQEARIYTYTLLMRTRQQVSFEQIARVMDNTPKDSSSPDYTYDYELRANLVVVPLQRISSDWLLVWKFESPRVTLRVGEGTLETVDTRPLPQQIEKITLFVRVSDSGEIRALWFTPPDVVEAHDLLRAVVARLQVSLSKQPAKQWMTEEIAPEGVYRAQYVLLEFDEKRSRIRKWRVSYIENASSLPIPQTLKPNDDLCIEIRNGVLYSIDGRFQTQALASNKQIASETTTLRLQWREMRAAEASRLQAWRNRYRLIAHKPETLRVPERASTPAEQRLADQQLLGHETLETLQRKLAQLPADAPFEQIADLMPKWTALVRLHPELSGRLVLQIAPLDLRSPQAQVLLAALREAGHSPAQAALVQLARLYLHRRDAESYAMLIPNFAFLNTPTEPTESALKELAQIDDPVFANPARLALGGLGHKIRDSEPGRARRLGLWMTRQIEQSTTDAEREVWLLALGNLGINDTFPTIQAYISASNENLRMAATGALRFLTLPNVESLLLQQLHSSQSRLVKQEAISAFQYRVPTNAAVRSFREYLSQETDKDLRRSLLEVLQVYASKSQLIVETIQWVSENDPEVELRLYAQSLLQQIR